MDLAQLLDDFEDGWSDDEQVNEGKENVPVSIMTKEEENVPVKVTEPVLPPKTDPVTQQPPVAIATQIPPTVIKEKEPEPKVIVPPPVIDTPPPTPSSAGTTQITTGFMTCTGTVCTIDDEHQLLKDDCSIYLPPHLKQYHVRYSYVEKRGMRKQIKILELLDEAERREVALPTTTGVQVTSTKIDPIPEKSQDPELGTKWTGEVVNVRTSDGCTQLEVHFENGVQDVIELTQDTWNAEFPAMVHDMVSVFHEKDADAASDDYEEEDELTMGTIKSVIPAAVDYGGAPIAMIDLDAKIGVIGTDICFELAEGLDVAVGDYVEYACVACKRDEFKWRCQQVSPGSQQSNQNNEPLVRDLDNHRDREGLSVANRDELQFRAPTTKIELSLKVIVRNDSRDRRRLLNVSFYSEKTKSQMYLKTHWNAPQIHPQESLEIHVFFRGRFQCNHTEYIVLCFNKDVVIVAPVKVTVGSDAVVRSLVAVERGYMASRAKLQLTPHVPKEGNQIYRVSKQSTKFVNRRLGDYPVPMQVFECMAADTDAQFEEKCLEHYPYLEDELSPLNYKEFLHQMIYISEAYLKKCFQVYELREIQFDKDNIEKRYYRLFIEGLAESRPSVLVEDMVRLVTTDGEKTFIGSIKMIKADRVLFDFHEEFEANYLTKRFNVTFFYHRAPFKRLHQGLDDFVLKFGEGFLFPETPEVVEEKPPLIDLA